MPEHESVIEQILSAFDDEMSTAERGEILAEIYGGNPPSPMQAYTRQTHRNRTNSTQREVLRRALRRVFPSDEAIKEMIRPAAEKAVQEAVDAVQKGLK